MDPLTASIVILLGKNVIDAGVRLAQEGGPAAANTAGAIAKINLDYLRHKPEGKMVAD